jgi:hypothetical protein
VVLGRADLAGELDLNSADVTFVVDPTVPLGGGAFAGRYAAAAGDVDGDGFDDLLIGDGSNEVTPAGVVYLLKGQTQPAAEYRLVDAPVKFVGEVSAPGIGAKLAAAGDVNGDGAADILLGTHSKAYLIHGAANLQGIIGLDSAEARFSASYDAAPLIQLSTAGDLDDDGNDDVLLSFRHPNDPESLHAGASFVFYGPIP